MRGYVICDGDQTLYENVREPVSNQMLNVMHNLILNGYGLGVISGTTADEIARLIRSKELARGHHILGNSGGSYYYYDGLGMKKVYELSLSKEDKGKIYQALELLIKEFNIESLTSKEDQLQDRGSQITLSALGRNAPIELKDNYDQGREKRNRFVEFLRRYLSDEYKINIGGTTSIDITKGIDKAVGIEMFANHHNIRLSDIIFFGDKLMPGGNDYSVTRLDGVKCVSVNNVEETLEELVDMVRFKMPGYHGLHRP